MLYHERSEDYRPLFWVSGRPVYVNILFVILHVLAFAVVALMASISGAGVLDALGLGNGEVVYRGQVWRLFSYVIFPPGYAISFIFAMGFLYGFGRQVEEFVGRSTYIKLLLALILIPSLLSCLLAFAGIEFDNYLGSYGAIFGVFVAMATIYPGAELRIWFVDLTTAQWCYVLLGALSLADIAFHRWVELGDLWCAAAIGYLGMRLVGAGRGMAWLTDWLDDRRTQRLARQHNLKVLKDTQATQSIDEILEKISKHGVGSLNARERASLERARSNLLKRDQP